MALLGENIFDTGFCFDVELRLGAGAFVCGEETALMTSIEGKRGEPRPRPPFPAVEGSVRQADHLKQRRDLRQYSTDHFKRGGLVCFHGNREAPRERRYLLWAARSTIPVWWRSPWVRRCAPSSRRSAAAFRTAKKFKAAQTGGPSGGCIPASHIDIPIDYDNLIAIGSMMGSGGLIVMDEDDCMVDIAKFFLEFTVDESCGKCTPCRIGTKRMLEILDKITKGNGDAWKIWTSWRSCATTSRTTPCAAWDRRLPTRYCPRCGISATSMIAHVVEKRCPAGVCKASAQLHTLIHEKCKGCTLCARNCPAGAIIGTVKQSPCHRYMTSASSAAPAWKNVSSAQSTRDNKGG